MKFSLEKSVHVLESENYTFFTSELARHELFDYSKSISEYIRSEKIPNLVVIDRSARPMYTGVVEYFKSKYPNEKRPNIYFMNPKGFKAKEDLTNEEIDEILDSCKKKKDIQESAKKIRSKEKILQELEDVYKNLMHDKDKPLLVFDTCIHSGDSLDSVKKTLIQSGFSDIRIGAVQPSKVNARVTTDYYATQEIPQKECVPFGKDYMVHKTFNHVYSVVTKDALERESSVELRKEIKKIMTDFLKKE